MTEAGNNIVEPVPMPDPIRDAVAAFVAEHHVEQAFVKRKRDRADPESLGRRPPARVETTNDRARKFLRTLKFCERWSRKKTAAAREIADAPATPPRGDETPTPPSVANAEPPEQAAPRPRISPSST